MTIKEGTKDEEKKKKTSAARRAKSFGREGQYQIRDMLLKHFTDLTEDDVVSRPMGSQGSDIMLSTAALAVFPFDVEVKYRQTIQICTWMKQSEERLKTTDRHPIVFSKCRGRGNDWYVTISAKMFLELWDKGK